MKGESLDRVAVSIAQDGLSRRRALGVFAGAVVGTTAPWLFPSRARAADCGTYCASGGGCTGAESACCCIQRTSTTIQVGGCYDPSNHDCVDTGTGALVKCKPQYDCNGRCCATNQTCQNGFCVESECGAGKFKCRDACCDSGTEKCCAGVCCKNSEGCCKDTCCDKATEKCCTDHCCKRGQACCGKRCCPQGQKCGAKIGRGATTCCPPARVENQGGRRVCCPRGTVATGSGCCPPGNKDCCGDLPPLGRRKICVRGNDVRI